MHPHSLPTNPPILHIILHELELMRSALPALRPQHQRDLIDDLLRQTAQARWQVPLLSPACFEGGDGGL